MKFYFGVELPAFRLMWDTLKITKFMKQDKTELDLKQIPSGKASEFLMALYRHNTMRKKDREITDKQEIIDILKKCDSLRLGFNTPDYPYIVPMNFGIETNGESVALWFHCANEGLKLDLIKQDKRVGFEADCSHRLVEGDDACSYTMEYESVIGCGNIFIENDNESKKRGLTAIMQHYEPEKSFEFHDSQLNTVCVMRLDVMQITGKRLSVLTNKDNE